MDKQTEISSNPQLDEWEAAQLARAVEQLAQALGFPPEDVNRSYKDSLEFFLKNP